MTSIKQLNKHKLFHLEFKCNVQMFHKRSSGVNLTFSGTTTLLYVCTVLVCY